MTTPTMKSDVTQFRDPFLVFAAMPKGQQGLPDATQQLWDAMETGKKIGPFTFIRCSVQSFSTAKARNILTAIARSTNAGQLLMIDADMGAGPAHIERILSHKVGIVGGVYPKKTISLTQQWVLNWSKGATPRSDGLCEVMDIGAGFLKIDLNLIDELIEARGKDAEYVCEDDPWRGEIMWNLWEDGIVVDDWNNNGTPWPRYLTEDFYFCHRVRKLLAKQIWADTLCTCGHFGMVDYLAVMQAFQQLTTPATSADQVKARLPEIVR